jgi:hypothetical protein
MADSVLTYQWTNDWMITPITPGVLQKGEEPPQTILDHKFVGYVWRRKRPSGPDGSRHFLRRRLCVA